MKYFIFFGLIIIILLIQNGIGCPFYVVNPRTNYSSLTSILSSNSVSLYGYTAHACVGSMLQLNETIPIFINFSFTLIGDPDLITNQKMIFQVSSPIKSEVFLITGIGTVVVFRDLQFIYNTTLVIVGSESLLRIYDCYLWIGNIGIIIMTTTDSIEVSGFYGKNVVFGGNGIGIHQITGFAVCYNCRFLNSRIAGISTQSQVTSRFSITWSVWDGDSNWISIISSFIQDADEDTNYPPLLLPIYWNRINNNLMFGIENQCMQTQSQSPGIFGGGGGGVDNNEDINIKSNNASDHPWTIALVSLTLFGIIVVASFGIIACVK
jgi:hypothetical protein